MGRADDPAAMIDAEGRVHGTRGLRGVNASIFPEAISVLINLTTLMVAGRIAKLVRKEQLL